MPNTFKVAQASDNRQSPFSRVQLSPDPGRPVLPNNGGFDLNRADWLAPLGACQPVVPQSGSAYVRVAAA